MDRTEISWTDATLNAIRGCQHVSHGCDHCYAASVAYRFNGPGLAYENLATKVGDEPPRFNGLVKLVPEKLEDPLRWARPRRVFVNSMSDLFYARIPRYFVDQHFATFALAQRHQFQILTKRPDRMARYINDPDTPRRVAAKAREIITSPSHSRRSYLSRDASLLDHDSPLTWPLSNVWLGTSIESNEVIHRARDLIECQAAYRFVSAEPLLGPLSLEGYLGRLGIHWVIVGGESGPDFRPMDLDWARALRDECALRGVAFFYKQLGGLKPGTDATLDGVEHHAFPAALGAVA